MRVLIHAHNAGLPRVILKSRNRLGLLALVFFAVLLGGAWAYLGDGGIQPTGDAEAVCFLALFSSVVSLFGLVCAYAEMKLKRDVASKGNAACFKCGHRLIHRDGPCTNCGWEYEDIEEVKQFWAEWEPHRGTLRSLFGGKDKDGVPCGTVRPVLLTKLQIQLEALLVAGWLWLGSSVLFCRWYLQTPATGFPGLEHYIVALWALFPAMKLYRLISEMRLKREVAGKGNAACFECGYWLTEPNGRCPECGWEYENLEEVREFWTEWQPCRYIWGRRKKEGGTQC